MLKYWITQDFETEISQQERHSFTIESSDNKEKQSTYK